MQAPRWQRVGREVGTVLLGVFALGWAVHGCASGAISLPTTSRRRMTGVERGRWVVKRAESPVSYAVAELVIAGGGLFLLGLGVRDLRREAGS